MPKVDEETFQELESQQRHEELIRSLKDIADRSSVESLVKSVGSLLDALKNQKPTTIDLKPLITTLSEEMVELKTVLEVRPKAFNIERNKIGLIERIVPEY